MMSKEYEHLCPLGRDRKKIFEVIRVTGGDNPGLFGHNEALDWHTNRPSGKDRKPIVFLQAISGTQGSKTSWLNNQIAYQCLDSKLKRELSELRAYFGFKKNNYTSSKLFKEHMSDHAISLVQRNEMTGDYGLFFPYLQIMKIENFSDIELSSFIEMMKVKILKEEYIYDHLWRDGDIVISEQNFTIHKRWPCEMSKRLLHRISFDYAKLL